MDSATLHVVVHAPPTLMDQLDVFLVRMEPPPDYVDGTGLALTGSATEYAESGRLELLFPGLLPGKYAVQASCHFGRWKAIEQDVPVAAGESRLSLVLQRCFTVTGVVRRADGRPLQGVPFLCFEPASWDIPVSIFRSIDSPQVDALVRDDGSFTAKHLWPGRYVVGLWLRLGAESYPVTSRRLELRDDCTFDIVVDADE